VQSGLLLSQVLILLSDLLAKPYHQMSARDADFHDCPPAEAKSSEPYAVVDAYPGNLVLGRSLRPGRQVGHPHISCVLAVTCPPKG
jgi:hypothetical protein